MYLTALTHRDRLFEVATRWIRGDVRSGDGRFVSEAFLVDPCITTPTVAAFLRDVAGANEVAPRIEHLHIKDDVRRRIAGSPQVRASQTAALLSCYRERPEEFYPTTPVDLFSISSSDGELLAMVRFKNLLRIADKVARRAAAGAAPAIRRAAEALAAGRPTPPPGELLAEAERQVCLELTAGQLEFSRDEMRIDDAVGAKLIGDPARLSTIEESIASHPLVISMRRSEHRGAYNDTRFEVELAAPPPGPTIKRLLANDWIGAVSRGLEPRDLRRDIAGYVESGARSFFVEVILTTSDELVESEFGRGLHERRTERQRGEILRAGQLATNVGLAVTSLLLLAIAPTVTMSAIPVKLSGRYLPDTVVAIVSSLFGLDLGGTPLWLPAVDDPRPAQPTAGLRMVGGLAAVHEAGEA